MYRVQRSCLFICIALGSPCVQCWAEQASFARSFEVGQRWTYKHTGPRIGALEPETIDGERIRQVVSGPTETGEQRWVIEERYSNSETGNARLFVNTDGLITAVEFSDRTGKWGKYD